MKHILVTATEKNIIQNKMEDSEVEVGWAGSRMEYVYFDYICNNSL